jgi:hypothetical protein
MTSQVLTWGKLVEELLRDTPPKTRDFTKEVIDESDRGVALICTEDLNLKLEELFRSRSPIREKAQVKRIVDPLFDAGGPLSSFSFRTKLAYSFGYIGEPLFAELEKIRQIRNRFAHSSTPLRFDSPSVSPLIQQFRFGRDYQALFLRSDELSEGPQTAKKSPERWLFIGSYFHAELSLRTLTGTAPTADDLAAELNRIRKEYGL